MINRRTVVRWAAGSVAAAAVGRPAFAQQWPQRNITLVVPFTPGGSTDILARLIGQKLQAALGQSVVVESRPGAGGSIGADAVAKAAPDGYTLLMGHIGTLAVNPSIYPKLGYDPLASFAHVSMIARVHNVLVANPDVPARSVTELIAHIKANPGKLNYASGGNGSAAHIAMAAFAVAAGLDLVHVPYRGTAPAVTDVIGGRVETIMTGAPVVLPQAQAGKLRALGVSGLQRLAAAPDLPTIAEAALPGFEASQWYGIVAPAGTPAPIVDRLNVEIGKAMNDKTVVDRLALEGADVWTTSPEAFKAHIASQIPRWAELVKKANIRGE
ncbi:tripartite tricarboxylate transporter substrate binding protein [uncultured Alsobacter sp.]|uniref:Bug family tripartite tricarboxylate transporter substrate binding protein n=1 Tax=uncultured Alsobacter sp. TaxID=1748258 RepID=UPI0025CE78C6|nr:tripartite tricarboxylate transporter substrate binding protein [uncultured Alsobacter sp.]